MRARRGSHLTPILAALLMALAFATAGRAQIPLEDAERAAAKRYFEAADAEKWAEARRAVETAEMPLMRKALWWHFLIQRESGASFEEIASFALDNPGWPAQVLLARRADDAITPSADATLVARWFDATEPRSFDAWQAYIGALIRLDRREDASAAARNAWRGQVFDNREADAFLARHKGSLDMADHRARMAMLLRVREVSEARHLMKQVSFAEAEEKVYRVRLSFMKLSGPEEMRRIEASVKALPPGELVAQDMLYDRIRWHRKHGQDDRSRALLREAPPISEPQRRWWIERSIQVRGSLEDGLPDLAFELAAGHRQNGPDEAEQAEALAGWIALRYLDDPDRARPYFERALAVSPDAFHRARAHYWLARTEQAARRARLARRHYRDAAKHPATYYGQLAQRALGMSELGLPGDAELSTSARRAMEAAEEAQAARLFIALERPLEIRIFLARRLFDARTPEGILYVAALSSEAGRQDFQVRAGRRLVRQGFGFLRAGYPGLTFDHLPAGLSRVERPLILAVIRQESSFEAEAGSGAGARGLMQLLPGTARATARQLRVRYSTRRLTADPPFNTMLGTQYLHRLLIRYEGSYVLALSAYNAGPRNASSWVERLGDPRREDVDIVDWIERIPFGETRNYVRRVLANLTVYRALAGESFEGGSLHKAWRSSHYARCAARNDC